MRNTMGERTLRSLRPRDVAVFGKEVSDRHCPQKSQTGGGGEKGIVLVKRDKGKENIFPTVRVGTPKEEGHRIKEEKEKGIWSIGHKGGTILHSKEGKPHSCSCYRRGSRTTENRVDLIYSGGNAFEGGSGGCGKKKSPRGSELQGDSHFVQPHRI